MATLSRQTPYLIYGAQSLGVTGNVSYIREALDTRKSIVGKPNLAAGLWGRRVSGLRDIKKIFNNRRKQVDFTGLSTNYFINQILVALFSAWQFTFLHISL